MSWFSRSSNQKKRKLNWRLWLIFLLTLSAGFLVYPQAWNRIVDSMSLGLPHYWQRPFKLGLDLQGGAHLVYQADFSNIKPDSYDDSIQGVRDVIERRINYFGVAEPVVQVNQSGNNYRLIVELAGEHDIKRAVDMIGQTPSLDFREPRPDEERNAILKQQEPLKEKFKKGEQITDEELRILSQDPYFQAPELTGRYLKQANVTQDTMTFENQVNLQFDDEGAKLFEGITERNVGKPVAIYLDGAPISTPRVNEKISGGKAQITGNFSIQEARELAQRLNAGALPVPIKLISQQTIGASLGKESLAKSLTAGLYGLLAVFIFMILYYRWPGFLAGISLLVYLILVLAVFKLIPVTLTLAGIAGFILSLGMAVDANVVIFERIKEELRAGKSLGSSIDDGFSRAWAAVRDGNIATLITCLILYLMATSLIKGYALTLAIGTVIAMFTAITVTRTLLLLFAHGRLEKIKWLWK